MSYPCIICGKVGWYRVSNRNYCGDHKAEAWADRKKVADLISQGKIKRGTFNRAELLLKHVWAESRKRAKK